MMRRIAGFAKTWLVPFALLAAAGGAEAQPQEGARTVRPGDALIDGTRVDPGVWEMRYLRVVDGAEQEVGRMHHELTVVRHGSAALLRSIQSFRNAKGEGGVDTVFATHAALAPRSHRSHHGTTSLALDFDGLSVHGKAVSKGEPTERHRTLDAAVFDASLLDLVLGGLQLAEGLHVAIPTYVHENPEPMWFDARVAGQESIEVSGVAAPAWAVLLTMPQGSGTFWIDRDSRQLVKAVMTGPDGSEFRMLRVSRSTTSRP
jgi:hypothetical protein